MTVDALIAQCHTALQLQKDRPKLFDGTVSLVIPRPWTTQRRMKLLPTKGAPYGEPISGHGDATVVAFHAADILAFLESSRIKEGAFQ